jgi:hypothetical protein
MTIKYAEQKIDETTPPGCGRPSLSGSFLPLLALAAVRSTAWPPLSLRLPEGPLRDVSAQAAKLIGLSFSGKDVGPSARR